MLTDYERRAAYVQNLTSARLLAHDGAKAVMGQIGRANFFVFQRTIYIWVRVTEHPQSRIDVALIKGNLKTYSARWSIRPATQDIMAGTRIDYSSSFEPDFYLPAAAKVRLCAAIFAPCWKR